MIRSPETLVRMEMSLKKARSYQLMTFIDLAGEFQNASWNELCRISPLPDPKDQSYELCTSRSTDI